MKQINPIKYDEDKIYAFCGTITVTPEFSKQYKKKRYSHVFVLGADRIGSNYINGKEYNEFRVISLTLGKQLLLKFDTFDDFLKILNKNNIELFIFNCMLDFILWLMKETLKMEKIDPKQLFDIFKEHIPNELGAMVRFYNDSTYFSKKAESKRYGCDNCGWVYGDTNENKSFEKLGKYFVCPECGNEKGNFTKLN